MSVVSIVLILLAVPASAPDAALQPMYSALQSAAQEPAAVSITGFAAQIDTQPQPGRWRTYSGPFSYERSGSQRRLIWDNALMRQITIDDGEQLLMIQVHRTPDGCADFDAQTQVIVSESRAAGGIIHWIEDFLRLPYFYGGAPTPKVLGYLESERTCTDIGPQVVMGAKLPGLRCGDADDPVLLLDPESGLLRGFVKPTQSMIVDKVPMPTHGSWRKSSLGLRLELDILNTSVPSDKDDLEMPTLPTTAELMQQLRDAGAQVTVRGAK